MNELVAVYSNQITCKQCLKELIEFAIEDEETACDEKGKLVAFIENNKVKRLPMAQLVKEMMPADGMVKDADYLYTITAYEWEDTCPIAEFNFGVLDAMHLYKGYKVVLSVHKTEEAIYVHTFVKREQGAEWNIPDGMPRFRAVYQAVPNAVIEYCEAMDYLMY